jgi:hypothetical protein
MLPIYTGNEVTISEFDTSVKLTSFKDLPSMALKLEDGSVKLFTISNVKELAPNGLVLEKTAQEFQTHCEINGVEFNDDFNIPVDIIESNLRRYISCIDPRTASHRRDAALFGGVGSLTMSLKVGPSLNYIIRLWREFNSFNAIWEADWFACGSVELFGNKFFLTLHPEQVPSKSLLIDHEVISAEITNEIVNAFPLLNLTPVVELAEDGVSVEVVIQRLFGSAAERRKARLDRDATANDKERNSEV